MWAPVALFVFVWCESFLKQGVQNCVDRELPKIRSPSLFEIDPVISEWMQPETPDLLHHPAKNQNVNILPNQSSNPALRSRAPEARVHHELSARHGSDSEGEACPEAEQRGLWGLRGAPDYQHVPFPPTSLRGMKSENIQRHIGTIRAS